MITAYLLIAMFFLGWAAGSEWESSKKLDAWQRIGLAALCIAWPVLLFLAWKVWRKEK